MVTIILIRNLRIACRRSVYTALPVALCAFLLVSCKSDGDDANGAAKSDQTTSTTEGTTAPLEQVGAGQLDFFTEHYASADERLKRRQDRIKAVLDAPTPAP